MKRIVPLFIALLLVSVSFAQLERLSSIPEIDDFEPSFQPGAWVEYEVFDSEKEETSQMKFSVLSKEECEDGDCFWFEFKVTEADGEWQILKLKGADPREKESLYSMIVQKKGEKPQQLDFMLPRNMPTLQQEAEDEIEEDEEVELDYTTEENVEIKVKAGTFNTTHIVMKEEKGTSDIWISEEVPMFGMVRAERGEEGYVELINYGDKGAKSEIQGKTERIEIPNLQQLMQQGQEDQ